MPVNGSVDSPGVACTTSPDPPLPCSCPEHAATLLGVRHVRAGSSACAASPSGSRSGACTPAGSPPEASRPEASRPAGSPPAASQPAGFPPEASRPAGSPPAACVPRGLVPRRTFYPAACTLRRSAPRLPAESCSGGVYSGGGVLRRGVHREGTPPGGGVTGGVSSCGGSRMLAGLPLGRIPPAGLALYPDPKTAESLPTRAASHRFRDRTMSPNPSMNGAHRQQCSAGVHQKEPQSDGDQRGPDESSIASRQAGARKGAWILPSGAGYAGALCSPDWMYGREAGYNGRGTAQTALRNPSEGVPRCEDERIFGQSF